MKYYTYAYLREDRTPYYIGKGQGNRAYEKHHKGISVPKDKSRVILLKQNLTEEEAFRHEIYMIVVLGRKDLGTGILHNRTNGGEGVSGYTHNEETRKKISEMIKGENNPNYGKEMSKEHKQKISEAHIGKTLSDEHKLKLSEALKGKSRSEESKRKQSEARKGNTNWLGKTHSEETKRKLSEANKGRIHTEETRRKMSEARKGIKWWNDGCGNCKRMLECPGNGWRLGRK